MFSSYYGYKIAHVAFHGIFLKYTKFQGKIFTGEVDGAAGAVKKISGDIFLVYNFVLQYKLFFLNKFWLGIISTLSI